MADWIDDLKRDSREHEKREQEKVQLRLHVAEVIRAKAPLLLAELGARVAADCEKLRKEFPNDNRYWCAFEKLGEGFAIRGHAGRFPRRTVEVRPNISGQCVDVTEDETRSALSAERLSRVRRVAIKAAPDEQLYFSDDAAQLDYSVEELSRQICSYVCCLGPS